MKRLFEEDCPATALRADAGEAQRHYAGRSLAARLLLFGKQKKGHRHTIAVKEK